MVLVFKKSVMLILFFVVTVHTCKLSEAAVAALSISSAKRQHSQVGVKMPCNVQTLLNVMKQVGLLELVDQCQTVFVQDMAIILFEYSCAVDWEEPLERHFLMRFLCFHCK
jgi:hypothetical protein